jgi:uncharacterized protein DUF3987
MSRFDFKRYAPMSQIGAKRREETDMRHPYSKSKFDKGKAIRRKSNGEVLSAEEGISKIIERARQRTKSKPDKAKERKIFRNMPALPHSAYIDPQIGADACQWLDNYLGFSHTWSPRAYEDFHEACALWLLSTIAARRICIHLGQKRYTNLYIALVARTSIFAKSTTADMSIQTLKEIGLDQLLMPDNVTPERFISIMANVPSGKSQGTEIQLSVGQRGWFYEEFGQHVSAMMKSGGIMSDFLPMLKRLDDGKDEYEYSTIKRGDEIIKNPYLALLGNLTPDCLRPFAKGGSSLWGDGFLARFALICPPDGIERLKDPFPKGRRRVPLSVSEPLKEWDKRLGSGDQVIKMTKRVRSAYEAYDNALMDLMEVNLNHDLDGNYAKLPERTMRVAVLLASVSGSEVVELKHWARAQEITERWRGGLHELYQQVNDPGLSQTQKLEERILSLVEKHHGFTMNTARQYFPRIPAKEVASVLDGLVDEGMLSQVSTRKGTVKFVVPKEV